jgi:hypothetical protein
MHVALIQPPELRTSGCVVGWTVTLPNGKVIRHEPYFLTIAPFGWSTILDARNSYDRRVARRPSDEWRRQVEEEASEVARGVLPSERAYASDLWPESLRAATDSALAAFEHELRAVRSPSDDEVLSIVERVVLALNKINDEHVRAGKTGYETGEREQLCSYIDAALEEAGIDVDALERRHGISHREIAGRWRTW